MDLTLARISVVSRRRFLIQMPRSMRMRNTKMRKTMTTPRLSNWLSRWRISMSLMGQEHQPRGVRLFLLWLAAARVLRNQASSLKSNQRIRSHKVRIAEQPPAINRNRERVRM
jgi:hypothetical protein